MEEGLPESGWATSLKTQRERSLHRSDVFRMKKKSLKSC